MEDAHQHTNSRYNRLSIAGLLISFGIVYGDIGTSPLYTLKAIFHGKEISDELIFGSVSCIFWTLTFQTTIKYILLTLKADNRGEGGIFALFALIKRYGNFLFIPAILGAATLIADGMITPPISVTTAIEALENIAYFKSTFTPGSPAVLTVVIILISGLFIFQRFGTKIVGFSFGPIMLIWFSVIFVLGFFSLLKNPEIIKGLNPYYGYRLLTHYPQGFWLLGAVFLCTTGAEALYHDLGHCGRKNIRVSWIFVKFALVVNYMGQAAWLLSQKGAIKMLGDQNPFFEIMPDWFLLIGIIIATVATIIASQALISGSFSLISEAINLNFWPRVSIKFPSDIKGQIYIPSINALVFVGCIFVVLLYRTSTNMEGAYGFAICNTMIMTTLLLSFYFFRIKKVHYLICIVFTAIYLFIEGCFFVANSSKFHQAWEIITISVLLSLLMFIWKKSKKITNKYLELVEIDKYLTPLADLSFDRSIPQHASHLVYMTKSSNTKLIEKRIIDSILIKKPKRANTYWFINIERSEQPFQMEYSVNELVNDKVIFVRFTLGYKIQPKINLFFKIVLQNMFKNEQIRNSDKYENLAANDFHANITYIMIQSYFSIENDLPFWDDLLMDIYFAIKNLAQKDTKAFGFDSTSVEIESVPLLINSKPYQDVKNALIYKNKL